MVLFLPISLLFLSLPLSFSLPGSSPTGQTARPLHTPSSQSLLQPMSFPFTLFQLLKLLPPSYEGILSHLVLNVFLMAVSKEFPDDACELAILVNRFHPVLLEILDEFGGCRVCSVVGLSSLLKCSRQMALLFICMLFDQTEAIEGCSQFPMILCQF
jgi:hypothetical protein